MSKASETQVKVLEALRDGSTLKFYHSAWTITGEWFVVKPQESRVSVSPRTAQKLIDMRWVSRVSGTFERPQVWRITDLGLKALEG